MTDIIYGTKLNYTVEGAGETLLLLHGWGGSMQSLLGVEKHFSGKFQVVNLDFPPFGGSGTPGRVWGVTDYVNLVLAVLQKHGIKKISIAAHSFGGRVAIYLAANYPGLVDKLVLVDSAGLKPRRGIKYRIRVFKYKLAKKKGLDVSAYGSEDYRKLPDEMKMTFTRIVNEDLTKYLKSISAETLIVWGSGDKDTPPYMARKLRRRIKNSGLVFLPGGHYAYAENYPRFLSVLDAFLT